MPLPVPPPPPTTTPVLKDKEKVFDAPWVIWLVAIWTAIRGIANIAPPVTSATPGIAGQLSFDQNFLYVCIQGNTQTTVAIWKRIPLTAF